MCTKDLYRYIKIYIKKTNVEYIMEKYYEDEITKLNERLTNLCIYFNPLTKKNELVDLLDKLNILNAKVMKDLDSDLLLYNSWTDKEISNDIIKQHRSRLMGFAYLSGKIEITRSTINSILEKIEDVLKNQTNENQQEIIEKSKEDSDTSYMG